ncbi:MAG: hypothetical protein QF464_00440 [Myxococcota bacterium]|jgi:acyl carrier protein|nr:hypothetical protein [Myxococcota bacterium]
MEPGETGVGALVRRALVDALALELVPEVIAGGQPLYEHPVRMDSLGFHRVIVELEVQRGSRFDEEALERTLFETVDDLVRFVTDQATR